MKFRVAGVSNLPGKQSMLILCPQLSIDACLYSVAGCWCIATNEIVATTCPQQFILVFFYTVHDDIIKWKHFSCYWPFVRGIHQLPVNSLHKGQWRRALMFSLICTWINGWVSNGEAGDLRCHRAHYDVTVMWPSEAVHDFFVGKEQLEWCHMNVKVSEITGNAFFSTACSG